MHANTAEQPITMEVHSGKFQSENCECGLYNFETNYWETLESHLFTCEPFICVCRVYMIWRGRPIPKEY